MHGSHEQMRARPGGLSWCKATSSSSVGLRKDFNGGRAEGLLKVDNIVVETRSTEAERVPTIKSRERIP